MAEAGHVGHNGIDGRVAKRVGVLRRRSMATKTISTGSFYTTS